MLGRQNVQTHSFPLYNLDNQIHGFSGRTVIEEENIPKWKHLGRKSDWVYPHHIAHPYIDKSNEVILVESIGDCMALMNLVSQCFNAWWFRYFI